MALNVTWCDAAICPVLGVNRKSSPHARNDAIDPERPFTVRFRCNAARAARGYPNL